VRNKPFNVSTRSWN